MENNNNNNNPTTATTRTGFAGRRTVGVRTAFIAVLTATGALLPIAADAGPVEDVEQSCLGNASGSADSLERWADHCGRLASEYRKAYDDCMRNAPGTADSRERWVDHCAAELTRVGGIG